MTLCALYERCPVDTPPPSSLTTVLIIILYSNDRPRTRLFYFLKTNASGISDYGLRGAVLVSTRCTSIIYYIYVHARHSR